VPRSIPDDRFEQLIDAATAVFIAQGFRRTQIADVAARMGIAKGSIYTYVESKEALFELALRHADREEPVELPDALPVATPPQGATLRTLRERLTRETRFPALEAALTRARVGDVAAELEGVLGELYDLLARHRTAIKLMDRCAHDYPELAKLWFTAGRQDALSLLGRYLEERTRRGRLRRFEDAAVAARLVLETLVFWAVHRHWDAAPQAVDEAASRRTVLAFLISALVKETK
jgi:AcrR family transcriptional regulator